MPVWNFCDDITRFRVDMPHCFGSILCVLHIVMGPVSGAGGAPQLPRCRQPTWPSQHLLCCSRHCAAPVLSWQGKQTHTCFCRRVAVAQRQLGAPCCCVRALKATTGVCCVNWIAWATIGFSDSAKRFPCFSGAETQATLHLLF